MILLVAQKVFFLLGCIWGQHRKKTQSGCPDTLSVREILCKQRFLKVNLKNCSQNELRFRSVQIIQIHFKSVSLYFHKIISCEHLNQMLGGPHRKDIFRSTNNITEHSIFYWILAYSNVIVQTLIYISISTFTSVGPSVGVT